ncbi:MAG: preprotein translocase subunit SecA [Chloroflexota bacterium]|nr:preprotein translocase subunit SecA [Chloroflexota bacterium]
MFKNIVNSVFGDPSARAIKAYREIVERINVHEPALKALSDDALRGKTAELRARLAAGETLDALLPEAFAVVREAAVRSIGMRHYDVQMIGGIVLNEGKIAEAKTGEGKTLVATLALYLNALPGKGAHLVTPNDYLSKVGVQQMGAIYHFLGMSVAVIQNMGGDPNGGSYLYDPEFPSNDARFQNLRPVSRREAYAADITYGTNNEYGFDYLRDNMVGELPQLVQRDLHFAIVDEVDNILIDEARTPLIISGQADEPSDLYKKFAAIVRTLRISSDASVEDEEGEPDGDYVVDIKDRVAYLTDAGTEKVERALGIDGIYTAEHADMVPYLDNSLRAHALYHLDKEYIVQDEQVIIVDEFTGRLMYGRRFSEGLHQAIEAKQGVEIRRENLTMATITFQNFFRMYNKLAGMTGTAMTESEEFEKIYNLEVVSIPTHRAMVRQDYEDLIYATESAKFDAIIEEIKTHQAIGQPVLVGTVAIETSERLSKALKKAGIRHEVLNAKQHEREAEIIAQAGRIGMVTIATNMAGRGVDILLGGNPEGIARERLRKDGKDVTQVTPDAFRALVAEVAREIEIDKKTIIENGGLFILGTERHEARRIDNQLRGRAGRQGDPGESRFYLSLEDDLMKRFGGDRVKGVMQWAKIPENEPIEHNIISRSIGQAQVRVEGYNFDMRKRVLEYDDVVNKQREVIYRQRKEILTKPSLRDDFLTILDEAALAVLDEVAADEASPETWDMTALYRQLLTVFPVPASMNPESLETFDSLDALEEAVSTALIQAYDRKTSELGEAIMRQVERIVMIRAIDFYWRRHLTDLDVLREGIGLVAMAQRDPLVEYKREAFGMWEALQGEIRTRAGHDIFRMQVSTPAQLQRVTQRAAPQNVQAIKASSGGAVANKKPEPIRKTGVKANIGRNDPCWCGSGKKYKNCHYKQDRVGVTEA